MIGKGVVNKVIPLHVTRTYRGDQRTHGCPPVPGRAGSKALASWLILLLRKAFTNLEKLASRADIRVITDLREMSDWLLWTER